MNPNRCSWCGRYMTGDAPVLTFTNLRGEERTQRHCADCRPNALAMIENNRRILAEQARKAV